MSEADFAAWKMQRTTVMEKALNLKFRQNLQLRDALLETGEKYLEESNNWKDTYWGVSYSMSLSGQRSNLGDNWNKEGGKNMLGHLLMKLRETLYIEMNTI
jgi:ribA/ribD-fused uncharacterized protein